jgi:hypothetical protein
MSKEIEINDAKCTGLTMVRPVFFGKEDKKDADFVIEAYTGEVVDRWWGKLAIDVSGIKAKKKMPIFQNHMPMAIVGFSNDTWKDGSFFVSGKFSNATDNAKQVKALAEEGFPWQASIGVSALKILSIEEGATHEVNGKKLKGPAEVWLESEVFETSFVPLGADDSTSVSVFEKFIETDKPNTAGTPAEKETVMSDKQETPVVITVGMLSKDHPAIVAQIMEYGADLERLRIKSVSEQLMPGHETLISDMMFDGKTTGPQAAVKILQAEKLVRGKALEGLNQDAIPPVNHTHTPAVETPAGTEADDGTPIEEKAKAQWDKDAKLRKEFGNDYAAYLAYAKATDAGHVRVLRNHKDK